MDVLRLDVQDVLVAGGGHAARLLDDVSHGVALVEQPQLQGNEKERFSAFKKSFSEDRFVKEKFFRAFNTIYMWWYGSEGNRTEQATMTQDE